MAIRVHEGLKPRRRINLGTFGDDPGGAGFMAQDEMWPGGLVGNVADSDRVMQQRNADMLAGRPTRAITGPLPSADWDAFFGSLQRKGENAAEHRMNFNPQLAGRGPGQGVGQLGFINSDTGLTEHPLAGLGSSPSLQGLGIAASRLNKYNRRY